MTKVTKKFLLSCSAIALTGLMMAVEGENIRAAIGGPAAQRVHKEQYLERMTNVVSGLEEESRHLVLAQSLADQAEVRVGGFATCELRRGCLTGVPGPGPTVDDLRALRRSYGNQRDDIALRLETRNADLTNARALAEDARVAGRAGREQEFNDRVSELHAIVSRVRGEGQAPAFDASGLQNSQHAQVSDLGRSLSQQVRRISRSPDLAKPVPVYRPVGTHEAVTLYPEQTAMAASVGYLVNLLTLTMFFIVMLRTEYRRHLLPGDSGGHAKVAPHDYQGPQNPDNLFDFARRQYPAE